MGASDACIIGITIPSMLSFRVTDLVLRTDACLALFLEIFVRGTIQTPAVWLEIDISQKSGCLAPVPDPEGVCPRTIFFPDLALRQNPHSKEETLLRSGIAGHRCVFRTLRLSRRTPATRHSKKGEPFSSSTDPDMVSGETFKSMRPESLGAFPIAARRDSTTRTESVKCWKTKRRYCIRGTMDIGDQDQASELTMRGKSLIESLANRERHGYPPSRCRVPERLDLCRLRYRLTDAGSASPQILSSNAWSSLKIGEREGQSSSCRCIFRSRSKAAARAAAERACSLSTRSTKWLV